MLNALQWSSTATTLKKGTSKKDFNKESVLERFKIQLDNSNVKTNHTTRPDFSWSCANVEQIVNKYFKSKFILIFPFSSPKLFHKQWPHYNELIKIINTKHSHLEIVIAPGSNEMELAKKIRAISITNNKKALDIMELGGLIKKSSFVIANDTGPAHMAAHLQKSGIVLFGYHTTPKKVSIETDIFKAIVVKDLRTLSAEEVYLKIEDKLGLIN